MTRRRLALVLALCAAVFAACGASKVRTVSRAAFPAVKDYVYHSGEIDQYGPICHKLDTHAGDPVAAAAAAACHKSEAIAKDVRSFSEQAKACGDPKCAATKAQAILGPTLRRMRALADSYNADLDDALAPGACRDVLKIPEPELKALDSAIARAPEALRNLRNGDSNAIAELFGSDPFGGARNPSACDPASPDSKASAPTRQVYEQLGSPLTDPKSGIVHSIAFSPDGRTLVSGNEDGGLRLWNVSTHKMIGAALTGHEYDVFAVAFDRDGDTLGSGGDDKRVGLWSARTHKPIGAPLLGHRGRVSDVAFSPDGRILASAGFQDSRVRLWDVRTHKRRGGPLVGGDGGASHLAFSPDGRTIATQGSYSTLRLWDVRTHKHVGALFSADSDGLNDSVAFSPDGRMLASAGDDKAIRLWDVRKHKQIGAPLTGHADVVEDVAFSPDGRTLASGSDDDTVRLWDVRTHKQIGAPLTGHSGSVNSVAFSPDGRVLASGSDDATIRLWRLTP